MIRAFILHVGILAAATNPPVTVPETLKAKPGRMAQIVVTTTGKAIKYVNPHEGEVDIFREYDPDPTRYVYRFLAPKEGTYKLHFYTAIGDMPSDPACVTIAVAGDVPTPPNPPGPGPGPGPTPDGFAASVEAAYAAETEPAKAAECVQLAALFRVASTSTVQDPTITTVGSLMAMMSQGRKVLIPDTALVKVRAVIGAELNKTLSAGATPLDAAKRAEITATFARIAGALEAVK